MMKLMDMNLTDLELVMEKCMQPRFRAAQIRDWLYRGARPAQMTNIPKSIREFLSDIPFGGAKLVRQFVSKLDDTVKYLFEMEDGELIEGVLMRYHHGNTLCLSTQAGCRMGCAFCASTLDGRVRNLTHGEMIHMTAIVERMEKKDDGNRGVTNIVLMGSGEPLDNFENTVCFLKRATGKEGLGISPRNISLSTCGLVEEIYQLMEEAPPVTLCISLHAHSDAVRDTLVPMNRRYPIKAVLKAARDYVKKTGRRVIFEYALIEGVNASREDALALSTLVKHINCHVNLIPLNPVKERGLTGVTRKQAMQFSQWLTELGVSATVRREMGTDIEGACGQLRRRVRENSEFIFTDS